ncbi:hypothetical protein NEMBOFW57_007900 [Staphylotrichum longicolle]|uniref:Histidine acid phosphatase n=1 Tax=Staphylotrichum longicolle TaxID=669026 RepID=A0AAD4EW14_9PEZI|nr:hypothetical protein NEMBOFW57_007900 [Staphylotrichum longicolle]
MLHASTLALAGLVSTAVAETVHGVVVFSRHGDRTTKHFGAQVLTPLGAQQCFQVGSEYRARYFASDSPHRINGISEFQHVAAQVWASAPDQSILLGTATSFLQGLYPPLGDIQASDVSMQLANSSSVSNPLSGYQYVTLHGINDDSPETVWIKGDDDCPVVAAASADFKTSAEYKSRLASTRDFYRSLYPLVHEIYLSADNLSYAKAYDIFDVINVENLHNATSPARNVTADQLFQLRTLADSAEFGLNYNNSQPARSLHARTLAASVLSHLNETVNSAGQNPKFALLAGSYDTFLAFFGLANLTAASPDFFGLPDYASTMAFELFTPGAAFDKDDLHVRYLFKNGSTGAIKSFPLFGSGKADCVGRLCQRHAAARPEHRGGVVQRLPERGRLLRRVQQRRQVRRGCHVVCCWWWRDDSVLSRGGSIAVLVVMAVAILGNLIWAAMWLVRRKGGRRRRPLRGWERPSKRAQPSDKESV